MIAKKSNMRDGILDKTYKALMLCTVCGGEYSADSGDYFNYKDDYIFKCCGKPCLLVTKETVYKDIL